MEQSQGSRPSQPSNLEGMENEDQGINASVTSTSHLRHEQAPISTESWQLIDLQETQRPAAAPRSLLFGIGNRAAVVTRASESIEPSEEDLAFRESDDDSEIDAMGVFRCAATRTRRTSDYYGPSSTLSLLSEARRIMSHLSNKASSLSASTGHDSTAAQVQRPPALLSARTSKHNRRAAFDLSVPPRSQADALLNSYWTWFHSLYPFLYRPAFDSRYQELWTPAEGERWSNVSDSYYSSMDDNLFHCMLNVVFALGSYFDPSIDNSERNKISATFFDRAKALVKFEILTQGNVFLVQALLLMAQYLQSTDMSTACWNIAGLAIRVAQGMGLHHDQDNCDQPCCLKSRLDIVETEMRRRAWTGCILLDR